MRKTRALSTAAAAIALAAIALAGVAARAQRIDPNRATTRVVGPPLGPSPTDRVDGHRSGLAHVVLPGSGGALRVAWKHSFGQSIEHPPIVLAGGDIVVLPGRGQLVVLGDDGNERGRTSLGAASTGPATALSDGTVVLVTSGGEAVGVRRGIIRFRTRLGGDRTLTGRVSPLSLDDGGVVVATSNELTALDADGNVRARAPIGEALATPLVAAQGKVIAVAASGAVYAWSPGREPVKVGSFGGPVDGGATLADAHTLLAVVEGTRLAALDLDRGVAALRAAAPAGLYLGPPAVRGQTAYVLAMTPGRTFAAAIDASGHEAARTLISSPQTPTLADGGAAPLVAPPHAGPVVDDAGTLAFATPDERIGTISASGAVEVLAESPWSTHTTAVRPKAGGGVAGVAPTTGGFVVASESGSVVKVTE